MEIASVQNGAALSSSREAPSPAKTAETSPPSESEDEGISFWDFLDVINPLQHIPIIGSIYRELTGDTISSGARIAGGALWGGPFGLALALVDAASNEFTGAFLDDHLVALVDGSTPEGVTKMEAEAKARAAEQKLAEEEGERAPPQSVDDAAKQVDAAAAAAAQAIPLGLLRPSASGAAGVPSSSAGSGNASTPSRGRVEVISPRPASTPVILTPGKGGEIIRTPVTGASSQDQGQAQAPETTPTSSQSPVTADTSDAAAMSIPLEHRFSRVSSKSSSTVNPANTARALTSEQSAKAMAAQGLILSGRPTPAAAVAAQVEASRVPLPEAAEQAGKDIASGPITVPEWADSAFLQAMAAYKRTGRLPGAGEEETTSARRP